METYKFFFYPESMTKLTWKQHQSLPGNNAASERMICGWMHWHYCLQILAGAGRVGQAWVTTSSTCRGIIPVQTQVTSTSTRRSISASWIFLTSCKEIWFFIFINKINNFNSYFFTCKVVPSVHTPVTESSERWYRHVNIVLWIWNLAW